MEEGVEAFKGGGGVDGNGGEGPTVGGVGVETGAVCDVGETGGGGFDVDEGGGIGEIFLENEGEDLAADGKGDEGDEGVLVGFVVVEDLFGGEIGIEVDGVGEDGGGVGGERI